MLNALAEELNETQIGLARSLLAPETRDRVACEVALLGPYFDGWRERQEPAPKRKVLKARRPAK